jgi:hypothetical protein
MYPSLTRCKMFVSQWNAKKSFLMIFSLHMTYVCKQHLKFIYPAKRKVPAGPHQRWSDKDQRRRGERQSSAWPMKVNEACVYALYQTVIFWQRNLIFPASLWLSETLLSFMLYSLNWIFCIYAQYQHFKEHMYKVDMLGTYIWKVVSDFFGQALISHLHFRYLNCSVPAWDLVLG